MRPSESIQLDRIAMPSTLRFIATGFALLLVSVSAAGAFTIASDAANPVAVTIDANPTIAGVQVTRSLVAEPTFTVDILVANVTDLEAFNFEVVYDQTKVSAPTVSSGADVDRNPDAQQSLLTSTGRSWACSPPAPSGDSDPSGTVGAARLSCFSTGVPSGPNVGTTPTVIAKVTFNAVAEGTSALTLRNVNTFQALGVETGSCNPTVVKAATCANASVTVPADIDGDGVNNADEGPCGGDKSNAARRPERIDGIFAGVDDDGDTQVDEALPPTANAYDCDGDGFSGDVERFVFSSVGTQDDQNPCGSSWPADFNDDHIVDISDVNLMAPPVFFTTSGPWFPRRDIVPDGIIDISDANRLAPPMFFRTCTP